MTVPSVEELVEIFEAEEKAPQCMGCGENKCSNEAIVHVTWQHCLCGKARFEVDYCMSCYNRYRTVTVGGKATKMARCQYQCRLDIYAIRTRRA